MSPRGWLYTSFHWFWWIIFCFLCRSNHSCSCYLGLGTALQNIWIYIARQKVEILSQTLTRNHWFVFQFLFRLLVNYWPYQCVWALTIVKILFLWHHWRRIASLLGFHLNRQIASLRFFEWAISGTKRWCLSPIVKHQWVSWPGLNDVHSQICNAIWLLTLSSLIVIITLLFNEVVEAIIHISIIIINFIFNYVHLRLILISCRLLHDNCFSTLLFYTVNKSCQVYVGIPRLGGVFNNQLNHIEVGVFVFEA